MMNSLARLTYFQLDLTWFNLPSPAGKSVYSVETFENSSSNQAGKGTGEHVSRIEDGHSCCNFLFGIELADHI